MTDEQINIAIAESLGWHSKSGANGGVKWVDKDGIGRNGGGLYGYGYNDELKLSHLPNYTSDMNAMHEAEKVLTAEQRRSYVNCIFNLPVSECESNTFATAAQRAKAFLRTIGKWEDKQ